jgi:hypothetical protein
MTRYRRIALCLVLFAVSVVYNVPILRMVLNVYDEGIILAGAERVLM